MSDTSFAFQPIGFIATPFADKFGIPRQPQLAPHATGTLQLLAPYNRAEAVRGLEAFSHVWLSWVFHQTAGQWQPTVRPPRLGGNRRVGVFASRSPFRPNPLGLSLVALAGIDTRDGVTLSFTGVDLVDGTPILDIKPYIPFVESQPAARGGFVDGPPPRLEVVFSPAASASLATHALRYPALPELIREVLAQDPRPAYADEGERQYGVRLYTLDIKWRCQHGQAIVDEIIAL
ncbi:tRNA (N6-threonylcarbamoyladenosine(37)-N6)-methyltransferase TrmO [Chitinilyticum litopenaei]|uniref:tRNA (N6-threonylcarbamoyladenosine(37)-N6)-methyltransferase TrmO n=1 Tax=Chitinilyticum litopenaei TaxID=1121276 RepID=UPI00048E1269|nr:tRNA (N6-threonylcarbamoyladenosine(37)-N6)-methyltransferase TrmO [Chitinilyticum litopenaei]